MDDTTTVRVSKAQYERLKRFAGFISGVEQRPVTMQETVALMLDDGMNLYVTNHPRFKSESEK